MGGSGGGGGSSGKVDFPDYMKTFHGEFLGTDSAVIDLTTAMNNAMTGASPYASFVSVDVNDSFLGSGNVITDFVSPFTYLNNYTAMDFEDILIAYRSANEIGDFVTNASSKITTMMETEGALIEDEINQVTLPAFKAGYRSANAVMSSAFVIGEAIIRSAKVKQLARNDATLRYESFKLEAELKIRNEALCIDYTTKVILAKRDIATTAMDFAKLYVAARGEVDDAEVEMAAKDALWDLKVFQYGGNFLGSISGSAVSTDSGKGSKVGSLISGAMGGAALGGVIAGASAGAIAGPMGIALGAAAGGLAGLLG